MRKFLGTVINDRYQVIEYSNGINGAHYHGRDLTTQQPVTLTFFSPAAAELPALEQALLREVPSYLKLSHHSHPAILDIGRQADAICVIAERVVGPPLLSTFRKQTTDFIPTVLALLDQLATLLEQLAAHDLGYSAWAEGNIRIDQTGQVKLLGIFPTALYKLAAVQPGTNAAVYRSPELASTGQPTPQSDVYALGVLSHQLLTGHKAVSQPLVRGALSIPVFTVLTQATQPDPTDRYPDAQTFVAALRQALSAAPVRAPAAIRQATSQNKTSTGIPTSLAIVLIGLLVLLGLGGVASFLILSNTLNPKPTPTIGLMGATPVAAINTPVVQPTATNTPDPTPTQLPPTTAAPTQTPLVLSTLTDDFTVPETQLMWLLSSTNTIVDYTGGFAYTDQIYAKRSIAQEQSEAVHALTATFISRRDNGSCDGVTNVFLSNSVIVIVSIDGDTAFTEMRKDANPLTGEGITVKRQLLMYSKPQAGCFQLRFEPTENDEVQVFFNDEKTIRYSQSLFPFKLLSFGWTEQLALDAVTLQVPTTDGLTMGVSEVPTALPTLERTTSNSNSSVVLYDTFETGYSDSWIFVGPPPDLAEGKAGPIAAEGQLIANVAALPAYQLSVDFDSTSPNGPCEGNAIINLGNQHQLEFIFADSQATLITNLRLQHAPTIPVETVRKVGTSNLLNDCDTIVIEVVGDTISIDLSFFTVYEQNSLVMPAWPLGFNWSSSVALDEVTLRVVESP